MLDVVQAVTDHITHGLGLGEDASRCVGVAFCESVINAIKHGNRNNATIHKSTDAAEVLCVIAE